MRFSVIIPTFNRPRLLDRCLTALGSQRYSPSNLEVLVIDDGSTPALADVIKRHASVLPVRYFQHDGEGPACARNRGLREAQGKYVVFTDDDCEPRTDWLAELDAAFEERPHAGLGGSIVSTPDTRIFGRASQSLVQFLYCYAESNAGYIKFFCSNNLAFPREELIALGGFEEAFPLAAAEDRDLCARWLHHGELHFVPGAVVEHNQQLNAAAFLAQHFRYGRGAFQFWVQRGSEGHPGRRLEPWPFYAQMLAFSFRTESFPRAVVLSELIALSQLACAAGYFFERRKGFPAKIAATHPSGKS